MSDVIIRAEGLGKKYLIGHKAERERYVALRDVLARTTKNFLRSAADMVRGQQLVTGEEVEDFWALKDISFEIKRGDVVGIIGRNGAGKSTLLKILSRITEPSAGRVEIRGRVASLLEVGTGFHPELTGRENIYLNGAILGMTRGEIRRRFDEIVTFAEVEKFLDTPVKRYSSGMYVRLAFAVAAHLEPEILVVDEVLAVGDAEFQRKCLGKMHNVAGHGRTILFVSHNMAAVNQLCRKAIFLTRGEIEASGHTAEVIAKYAYANKAGIMFEAAPNAVSEIAIEIARASSIERDGDGVILCLELTISARHNTHAGIEIRFRDGMGATIGFSMVGDVSGAERIAFPAGKSTLSIEANLGWIAEGRYTLSLDLTTPRVRYIQKLEDCISLDIARTVAAKYTRILHQSDNLGALCFPARVCDPGTNK